VVDVGDVKLTQLRCWTWKRVPSGYERCSCSCIVVVVVVGGGGGVIIRFSK